MTLVSFLLFSSIAIAADASLQLPTGDEVVAKMMARDSERQAALYGYTASRRYVLENQRHHKRAEMLVRMTCLRDGSKQFETISETGWGSARKHVFPRLLEAETEASRPSLRERSRLIPENYVFEMVGTEYVDERPAYVIAIAPKTPNKYLMEARIWIDADEYAIVRIEGKPAKNPSFWTKSVHFVHKYEKRGSFWFPVSDRSVTDVRIFGSTEVTIEYFDYTPNTSALSASRELVRGTP
jgi:outer membrane lipoprotein-sorting protein